MDALSTLLTGPRARDAFLLRSHLSAPWSIDVADEAALTVAVVITGSAAIDVGDGVTELSAGDSVVVRGPQRYLISDPSTPAPTIRILPEQQCVDLAGRPLHEELALGVRTWGNSHEPESVLLTGTYRSVGEVGRRLLEAVPRLIRVADKRSARAVDWLLDELDHDDPGQVAVLDRLLDLVMITTLRGWFTAQADRAPGWFRAAEDRDIGRVIGLIHDQPEQSWTVDRLAAEVGLSRAALARRFTALVGESPIAYLTGWRLDLAADLLRDPGMTLETIARRVGYATPFALSAAFKRHFGTSPRELRASAA